MSGAARRRLFPAVALVVMAAAAALQLGVFVRTDPAGGMWFLYGRDTIFHDAVVHQWIQAVMAASPGVVPLWMGGLQGGLPTVGAFLWTPLAPGALPFYLLSYPVAQWTAWWFALVIAGVGAAWAGRMAGARRGAALFAGLCWMLGGHVVTLIHAGHFQKVMALGWLPWMVGGALLLARGAGVAAWSWGAAATAAGLGGMMLSGHPQIAWTGMATGGAIVAVRLVTSERARRSGVARGGLWVAGVGAGLLLGGAQLLPGLEMAGLSNRAAGVPWAEAVATSYPPGELAELAVPRVKGSSVAGDVYTGEWGERIVSDYFGLVGLVMVLLALGAGRRRMPVVLVLAGLAAFWITVGLGRHTPLYGFLYKWAPGFQSFRSPGTFFGGGLLALALLAGIGAGVLWDLARRLSGRRWVAWMALGAVALLQAGDLARANRHFLMAMSWDRYRAEFLAPNPLDEWAAAAGITEGLHHPAAELSLRPLLMGGRALNGYHPIIYAAKETADRDLGFNTAEWYAAWGVTHLAVPMDAPLPPELERVAQFPELGRAVVALPDADGPVRLGGINPAGRWEWQERTANRARLAVELDRPGIVVWSEIAPPGLVTRVDGRTVEERRTVALSREVMLPAGSHVIEWEYRPRAWTLGVYTTALGAMLLAGAMAFAAGTRRRLNRINHRIAPYEDEAWTRPEDGGPY